MAYELASAYSVRAIRVSQYARYTVFVCGRFLALPNFSWRDFQKLYARYEPCIATDRPEKFHEDIPTSSEVIKAHTLNFKPNFWGDPPPFPLKCALARLG